MKKVFLILIAVVLLSVIGISCKKTCVCYGDANTHEEMDVKNSIIPATEKECVSFALDSTNIYYLCEWDRP